MKKYDSYKDSGVEWIGEIPSHWDIKPLFSIASKNKVKNSNLTENNVLSLSYGNIVRRDISDNFGLLPDSFDTYQIVENGMLVLRLTDLQNDKKSLRVGLVKERGIITSAYIGLVFDAINPTYAYYLLHDFDIQKVFYNFGSGVRQMMSYSDLKRLPIIKPNKEEQIAIANYLDQKTTQIDDLIAKKERLIQLLEEERTAIINQAVTKGLDPTVPMKDSGIEWLGEIPAHWEVKRLKYIVASPLKYGANEPAIDEILTDSRYIRITDFGKDGKLRKDTFKSLPIEKAENYLLEEGDILFARSGATVGKTFLFTDYEGDACFAGYLIKVTCNSEIMHYKFLYAFTNSSGYDGWKDSISQSATIENIGADKYNQLKLAVPPIDEQARIVDFIESQEKIFENISSKTLKEIELLKEYKTALISEVVTGKVDVRNEK